MTRIALGAGRIDLRLVGVRILILPDVRVGHLVLQQAVGTVAVHAVESVAVRSGLREAARAVFGVQIPAVGYRGLVPRQIAGIVIGRAVVEVVVRDRLV